MTQSLSLRITRTRPGVELPSYESAGAVGCDMASAVDMTLAPGEIALVPTGLVIAVPDGYALLLCSRSSTPRKLGLTPPHGLGIIDQDYCGPEDEIHVQVQNETTEPIEIERGARIAQALFVPVVRAEWEEAEPFSSSSRGGFGSTGL